AEGFEHCGFGDIFLEDLRVYREQQIQPFGITCAFPLWKKDTRTLIKEFLTLGFKAVIICLNAEKLDESFIGREIDENFLQDLPSDVDPCGENGEFHTFCYDGPIFEKPIKFVKGEPTWRAYDVPQSDGDGTTKTTQSGGFWFLDLLPD
ncbi:MAG: ATP-binding protein, partial [Bacteroidota bacterium]